ncbi:MAG: phage portal protein [Planctomycetota bacterium]|jgi:capsid protein
MEVWEKKLETFAEVESRLNSGDVTAAVEEYINPNIWDGQKYAGGLNQVADLLTLDYWELRKRSNELFHKNTYARGIVRRLVTNVITTGLQLECVPEEKIIGLQEDALLDWGEEVENRFYLYNNTPTIIDNKRARDGGALQRQAYMEALVGGDVLIVLRQDPKYKLPVVEIVQGDRVETPMEKFNDDTIIDGVKVDKSGRHVGFYVTDETAEKGWRYIAAYGSKTGRLQAKLIYGVDKREDGVRGEPLLAIAIQPISEIDKYRDSAQRKATLNSILVGAIERDPNSKYRTKSIGGAAVKKGTVEVQDVFNNNGVDANFGAFEAAVLTGLAWALEIPPEILFLSFNKNYSASQAAINEFRILLDKERSRFGVEYCDILFQDWFLSMVLIGKIQAPGYLENLGDAFNWDIARAWTMAEWTGAIKPSTDMLKATNAATAQVEQGFNTRERVTRELTNQKFSKVARRLEKENEMVARAMRPLLELDREFGQGAVSALKTDIVQAVEPVELEAV